MKEQKQVITIRKALDVIESIALTISFAGVFSLIMTVFLAPMMFKSNTDYYLWLFGSIAAILTAPALAWVEDAIKNSGKDEENAD